MRRRTATMLNYSRINHGDQSSYIFLLNLNTYVMGPRQLMFFLVRGPSLDVRI